MSEEPFLSEFFVKDCALAVLSTGRRAQTLRELRDILREIHPGSVYQHFWGTLLRPGFSDREFNNDFASWAFHNLHDLRLAERLAAVDPSDYSDLEELRQRTIDIIEERMDETELLLSAQADRQFHFVRSTIVVFDTHVRLVRPSQLPAAVEQMSPGSIFYHFIDARHRPPVGVDDFRSWLEPLGSRYEVLMTQLAETDPFFDSLVSLRKRLSRIFSSFFALELAEEQTRG